MLDQVTLLQHISQALTQVDLEWPFNQERGKVRDIFSLPDARRAIVTTDRLSAFDRVLAAVPFKGQVLNQLSAYWFKRTADLIPNHIVDVPDPNVSLVHECEALPVEVVVRGYISGVTKTALWTLYEAGERTIYGHKLPEGLRKDDQLPQPLITPTTKGGPGQHDERLTCAEVVERGLLDADTWEAVQTAALSIFARGQEVAQSAGFVLVDTKYEFGRAPDGTLMLIDEVHTPDSSRYWRADNLAQAQKTGDAPVPWDKEFVRLWYSRQNYRGDGEPPTLTDEIVAETARRYISLYEGLTGQTFEPAPVPAAPRIVEVLEGFYQ
ncbi:MAG: phosphoribosylaminoimidazolesuccinocarboxamide synthase [Chloroflexi bacterium]|nr:phosphoribosylaminoimidazolesuccinocarboxamide synthase [Chloroflexota bacterium]